MKEIPISISQRNFILQAISENKRLDGRQTYDYRNIEINFGFERGCCEVRLGLTRVLAQVSCEVKPPKASRPTEGQLFINVELSPMAAPNIESGRISEFGVELNRLLERCLKDSRCIDLESLCIVADQKVWCIRVDIHVLNHEGNVADCASIAAISALSHFRRPDVTVVGEEVTIYTVEEREPVPLNIHHMPVCITFAFFEEVDTRNLEDEYKRTCLLLDPTTQEEAVMDGKMVLGMNSYRDICTLHMSGKMLLLKDQVLRCASIAAKRVGEITAKIKMTLTADSEDRAAGKEVGLIQALKSDTILSNNQESKTVQIKLHTDDSSAGEPIKLEQETDEESKHEEEAGDEQVVVLGPGTVSIGEGGPCTWDISDEDTDMEITEEEPAIKKKKFKLSKKEKKAVETIELSGDSEEEEVTILQPDELDAAVELSDIKDEDDMPSRGWYNKDAFF